MQGMHRRSMSALFCPCQTRRATCWTRRDSHPGNGKKNSVKASAEYNANSPHSLALRRNIILQRFCCRKENNSLKNSLSNVTLSARGKKPCLSFTRVEESPFRTLLTHKGKLFLTTDPGHGKAWMCLGCWLPLSLNKTFNAVFLSLLRRHPAYKLWPKMFNPKARPLQPCFRVLPTKKFFCHEMTLDWGFTEILRTKCKLFTRSKFAVKTAGVTENFWCCQMCRCTRSFSCVFLVLHQWTKVSGRTVYVPHVHFWGGGF